MPRVLTFIQRTFCSTAEIQRKQQNYCHRQLSRFTIKEIHYQTFSQKKQFPDYEILGQSKVFYKNWEFNMNYPRYNFLLVSQSQLFFDTNFLTKAICSGLNWNGCEILLGCQQNGCKLKINGVPIFSNPKDNIQRAVKEAKEKIYPQIHEKNLKLNFVPVKHDGLFDQQVNEQEQNHYLVSILVIPQKYRAYYVKRVQKKVVEYYDIFVFQKGRIVQLVSSSIYEYMLLKFLNKANKKKINALQGIEMFTQFKKVKTLRLTVAIIQKSQEQLTHKSMKKFVEINYSYQLKVENPFLFLSVSKKQTRLIHHKQPLHEVEGIKLSSVQKCIQFQIKQTANQLKEMVERVPQQYQSYRSQVTIQERENEWPFLSFQDLSSAAFFFVYLQDKHLRPKFGKILNN